MAPNRSTFAACVLAAMAWLAPAHAALTTSKPLPPMAGISESAAKQRAALFAELAAAKDEADAREIEDKIWKFWLSFADENRSGCWKHRGRRSSASITARAHPLEELVKHPPDFAEGWNQLAYVLFLAGKYDASLVAIDKTLELEPLHYAALAGKGIILIQQGKEAEAQSPLKQRAGDQSVAEGAQPRRQGSGRRCLDRG